MTEEFLRHIRACNNATLPGRRRALRIGPAVIGWVQPEIAAALGGTDFATGPALEMAARRLAEAGLCRWRAEAFDVREHQAGPVLARVDRGALPVLGIAAVGVHVNGLVRQADGLHLWIARRAANKALDPGKLDHIVAGGVPAGMDCAATLEKEAGEEAGIPPSLARQARHVGTIGYTMERDEGLRRDLLHCYDLELPVEFQPRPCDGEVEAFFLWPLARACATVRDTDDFKFNVNLVLIDLFLRHGLIDPGSETGQALRAGLHGNSAPG